MDPNDAWHLLPWDSDFFGLRIARLDRWPLTGEQARSLTDAVRREGIDCLYALVPIGDQQGIRAVESAGFGLADVRIELDRPIESEGQPAEDHEIGAARPEDISQLAAIARVSHLDSRFFTDSHFPAERCGDLYDHWIRVSCDDFADHVLVARRDGAAIGYLSCHLDPDRRGRIGLVGVAEHARGMATGPALVDAALHWFASQGCERVTIATQARNVRAQRLYQSAGFRTADVSAWYHWWPNEPKA